MTRGYPHGRHDHTRRFCDGQALHLGVVLLATASALRVAPPEHHAAYESFRWCVTMNVVHQLGITLLWRAELHGGHAVTRACCGHRWLSLRLTACFDTSTFGMVLRSFVSVATNDGGSLYTPGLAHLAIAGCAATVAVYALGSALLLLGPSRISGADHFLAPGCSPPPLCRRGAYAACDHPLFYLGLLLFWAIALASGSSLAFALACFLHCSALAFLFGTEIPDMTTIYKPKDVKNC